MVLIHVANLIYLGAYLVKDVLWLRVLTVLGGLVLIGYEARLPMPLWAAIGWSTLFLAINLWQIRLLVLERRPVMLRPDDLRLYQLAFRRLTEHEFAKLLAIGQRSEASPGERLATRGQAMHQLIVLASGRARVEVNGKPTAELRPGCLVGELSFVTGRPPDADVVAMEPTSTVSWRDDVLQKLLETNAALRAAVEQVIGEDLIAKMHPA